MLLGDMPEQALANQRKHLFSPLIRAFSVCHFTKERIRIPLMDKPIQPPIQFAWLELTGHCQLHCLHCYANSGPTLGHGILKTEDWEHIIGTLADLGVKQVQFIGGEPTTHPGFCHLLTCAAELGLWIEVFSNLVSITEPMWQLFVERKVQLATSFYSTLPELHGRITGSATKANPSGSYHKTVTNIQKALSLGLPLRVGVIKTCEEQDISGTLAYLQSLGVKPIRPDRVRGVGRGLALKQEAPVDALCGKCLGKCAITSAGDVFPCIMARQFPFGNVCQEDLATILSGNTFQEVRQHLALEFQGRLSLRKVSESEPNVEDCPPDKLPECPPRSEPCPPESLPYCPPDVPCKPEQACPPDIPCPPDLGPCPPELICPPNIP
jgi:MoaA/NifB/PqqE/SkfB family radical SAM enzyme